MPVIALIGRPNVGKSTLFNRLTGTRDALVTNFPGMTRDRKYGRIEIENREIICIDTGGIEISKEKIKSQIIEQSFLAIKEADLVLFILDAHSGLLPEDLKIAKYLRSLEKKRFLLVANKTDGIDINQVMDEFYSLGFGKIYPISASHGRGVRNLMKNVLLFFINEINEINLLTKVKLSNKTQHLTNFKENKIEKLEKDSDRRDFPIKLAIIGRPNVGKSLLTNRLLGEDQVIVCDTPGTTHDSICISMWHNKRRYVLIDTAGVRRYAKIINVIEKFSVIKSLQAIRDSNVVLLVLNAQEGIVSQDLSLINSILDRGRSLIIAINKWDSLSQVEKEQEKKILYHRLSFIGYNRIIVHFISALYGDGINDLLVSACKVHDSSIQHIGSSVLTNVMNMAVDNHQPPLMHGRRIKLKYAHAGGYNPLVIVIHGNQVKDIPNSYKRYLMNYFCKSLNLSGPLIHFQFREGGNPYINIKS